MLVMISNNSVYNFKSNRDGLPFDLIINYPSMWRHKDKIMHKLFFYECILSNSLHH